MSGGSAVDLAREVVRASMRAGVREVVLCAGARNAALVAVLGRSPALQLWSFPEERSAGFFGLGRAIRLDHPVAVVTTSGTAAAELLPATIEAHYQGVPLLLITADRPPRFRGTGAPQAIEQVGLLGPFVAECCDLTGLHDMEKLRSALAGWSQRQPLHLNVCFEEPRADELERAEGILSEQQEAPLRPPAKSVELETFLGGEGRLVAMVGALPLAQQQAVAGFLERLGCAVFAEAASGLREHPKLESQLLRGGEAGLAGFGATRVLRLGGVPSARFWRDLEQREEVNVFSVTGAGFSGLGRPSEVCGFPEWGTLSAVVPAPDLSSDRLRSQRVIAVLDEYPRSEPALVRALSAAVPERSLVFLGNSLPVREWDTFAVTPPRDLRCFANRGANGIDGCVSTFFGLSADESESCWCVVGDLTALYDLAAPWVSRQLPPGRRRIVVINNGGGRIFSRVEALRRLPRSEQALMENPHALRFRAWADLWGWDYCSIATAHELTAPLAGNQVIVEITPDAGQTANVWHALDG